jgi:hypothetical protein
MRNMIISVKELVKNSDMSVRGENEVPRCSWYVFKGKIHGREKVAQFVAIPYSTTETQPASMLVAVTAQ